MYDEKECQCFCKNIEDQDKCDEDIHTWNSRTCKCECRLEEECTTGSVFNQDTCRCVVLKESKKLLAIIKISRKSYVFNYNFNKNEL